MNKAAYPLRLLASIEAAAARLAKEDEVGLDPWIATAVAQKVGAAETAAAFFARRAQRRTGEGLGLILDKVPDRPAGPGEELPEGWAGFDRKT